MGNKFYYKFMNCKDFLKITGGKNRAAGYAAGNFILLCLFCTALYAYDLQISPIRFYHESYNTPQLKTLISEFDYSGYISSGSDEFERMILLKNWVFYNIKYDFVSRTQNLRNALVILRRARKGRPFLCTNFSAVYMQCAISLGWTSRYFFVRKPDGREHALNDVWSNQYNKWVFIDPTWNIHLEKKGIPLSLYEARNEWIKNGGKDVIYVFGAGESRIDYSYSDLPVKRSDNKLWKTMPVDKNWLGYTYEIAMPGRNNFFSHKRGDGRDIWDLIYIIKDRINRHDKKWAFRKRKAIDGKEMMFHPVNRASVEIRRNVYNNRSYAEIILSSDRDGSYTPNFKAFLVNVNNSGWKMSAGSFRLKLKPGINSLKARIVNQFGIMGPITEIKIESYTDHH